MHRNEKVIRELYAAAEAATRDTPKFVSLFAADGYFLDVPAQRKYQGAAIGTVVDVYATAFPDMHREILDLYVKDDVVVIELALRGTHLGELPHGGRVIAPTGRKIDVPCCDVFHLKDGKVTSFHCYNAASITLQQLGIH